MTQWLTSEGGNDRWFSGTITSCSGATAQSDMTTVQRGQDLADTSTICHFTFHRTEWRGTRTLDTTAGTDVDADRWPVDAATVDPWAGAVAALGTSIGARGPLDENAGGPMQD